MVDNRETVDVEALIGQVQRLVNDSPAAPETADAMERWCALTLDRLPSAEAERLIDGNLRRLDMRAPHAPATGMLYLWSGNARMERDDFSQAISRFVRAGRIFARYPEQESRRLWALTNRGKALVLCGRSAEGEAVLAEALDHYVQGKKWPSVVDLSSALGEAAESRGDVGEADRRFSAAARTAARLGLPTVALSFREHLLRLHERCSAEDSRELAIAMDNVATTCRELGDLDRSQDLGERALWIARAAGAELDVSICLQNLATTAFERGQHGRAARLLDDAMSAMPGAERQSARMVVCLSSLGAVRRARGDVWGASVAFGDAVALAEELGLDDVIAGRAIGNLASLDLEPGADFTDETLRRLRRAGDLLEAGDPAERLTARANLATALLRRDAVDEAIRLLRDGVTLGHRIAPDASATAELRVHLAATLLADAGAAPGPEAMALLDHAIDVLTRRAPESRGLAMALTVRARVHRRAGHVDAAIVDLQRATEIVEYARAEVSDSLRVRISSFAERHEPYRLLVGLLLDRGADGDHDAALHYAELCRARALLDQLETGGSWHELPGPLAADLRTTEIRLAAAKAARTAPVDLVVQAAAQAHLTGGQELVTRLLSEHAALLKELPSLEERAERLRESVRAEPAGRLVAAVPPSPAGTRSLIAATHGTALLAFLDVTDGIVLWIVAPDGAECVIRFDQAARDRIAVLCTDTVGSLHDPGAERRCSFDARRAAARQLGNELFGRVPPSVFVAARRLLVIPDGPLHLVPLDLLPSPLDPDALIADRWPTTYGPSLAVLAKLAARPPEPAPEHDFVGFGDPVMVPADEVREYTGDLGSWLASESRRLSPLPGTAREVAEIAKLFPGAAVVTGADFTEVAVRELAPKARYLHFATHSVIDPVDSLYSGLVVSPLASGTPDDAFLQVYEMARLRLRAEVVVCSACQTGVGRFEPGEGVIGMTQALLAAGARCVVVSLWPVPDSTTVRFMTAFYAELAAGRAPVEALDAARRTLRARHPDPFYWASFICVGALPTA
ncbi:CHAT domain-containing tetratricopeptide repeat protein [Jidongwangia harbinensis]|uniref:CHAT domain-containing tetratricopeptide repeat protein n=1 Tax=Jidongwangia harbinensis TaxID=2878561 RepID=UPI001CD9D5D4|nr:CHAT domain-containing tetratricopeptide repeat protein [Jidongwangia harbinensis]MCA2211648.1 CHAT domain-containing protein [Jidongwangia harbinensis]